MGLTKVEKINLILDLVSDYSFSISLKLNRIKQAAKFRCQNPFFIKYVLGVDFLLLNNEFVPVEMIVVHFDGLYMLSKYNRETKKIERFRNTFDNTLQHLSDNWEELNCKYDKLSMPYKWTISYGFDVADSTVFDVSNLAFTQNLKLEAYTFVSADDIGFPEDRFVDFKEKHQLLTGTVNYIPSTEVVEMKDLKWHTQLLNQFEYYYELNKSDIEFPAFFEKWDGSSNLKVVSFTRDTRLETGMYNVKCIYRRRQRIFRCFILVHIDSENIGHPDVSHTVQIRIFVIEL